ncbi:hypothetical protein ACHHYP_05814, partial [Achlya hypogyna]
SKPDVTKRVIRVDQRLEKHRVLKTAIRHKILLGVKQLASKDGFDGIRDVLCAVDRDGAGTLAEAVFVGRLATLAVQAHASVVEALLEHMKSPLTAKEMTYLAANLRNRKRPTDIDYEQIGSFLSVDSEEEASTSGEDTGRSQRKKFEEPHLGSDILSLERDLRGHMLQRLRQAPTAATTPRDWVGCRHAPPSIFTGAEKFVEACELYDPLGTSCLSEEGFCWLLDDPQGHVGYAKVLEYSSFAVAALQLRAILSKFPRSTDGNINYVHFLEWPRRYGQKYATVKQQRHMKAIVLRLATDPTRDIGPIVAHFKKQLDKVDRRITGVRSGLMANKGRAAHAFVPTQCPNFVSVVTTHETWKWPAKEVAAIVPLFAAKEPAHVHYDAFLQLSLVQRPLSRMIEECTQRTPPVPCKCNELGGSQAAALEKRLRAFLLDSTRGGARGYDIALHAFEAADATRHPKTAPTGLLHERDFFTVLRTIGTGISPVEQRVLLGVLTQAGAVTPNGVLYTAFLKYAHPRGSGSRYLSDEPAVAPEVPAHLRNLCVGAYLAEFATSDERRNFSRVMDAFAAMGATPTPATNELVFALGPTLKVKLQFLTQ